MDLGTQNSTRGPLKSQRAIVISWTERRWRESLFWTIWSWFCRELKLAITNEAVHECRAETSPARNLMVWFPTSNWTHAAFLWNKWTSSKKCWKRLRSQSEVRIYWSQNKYMKVYLLTLNLWPSKLYILRLLLLNFSNPVVRKLCFSSSGRLPCPR